MIAEISRALSKPGLGEFVNHLAPLLMNDRDKPLPDQRQQSRLIFFMALAIHIPLQHTPATFLMVVGKCGQQVSFLRWKHCRWLWGLRTPAPRLLSRLFHLLVLGGMVGRNSLCKFLRRGLVYLRSRGLIVLGSFGGLVAGFADQLLAASDQLTICGFACEP